MIYRNIYYKYNSENAENGMVVRFYGTRAMNEILVTLHPKVGIELEKADDTALNEFAENFIDVNYDAFSECITDPKPRPKRALSAAARGFAETIERVADYIVEEGRTKTTDGNEIFELEDLDERFGTAFARGCPPVYVLQEALDDRKELYDVDVCGESAIDLIYNPAYCPNYKAPDEDVGPAESDYLDALLIRPNAAPETVHIFNTLGTLQNLVGGWIETVNLGDAIAIVNEEGKINGLSPNRRLGNDILCGDFLIVGSGDSEFTSLTPEQIEHYTAQFAEPEQFSGAELRGLQMFTM